MLIFGDKAQAAMEYMMIMSLSLLIIVPIFLFMTGYTYQTRRDLQISVLQSSLKSVANTADMIHTQGYPARTTTNLHLPDNVEHVNVINNTVWVRVRYSSGYSDFHGFSNSDLHGELPQTGGSYLVHLAATEEGYVNVSY